MIQDLLQIHLKNPLESYSSTQAWAEAYNAATKDQAAIDKAIIGGFMSQQFSFTFLAAYQAALENMFPLIAPGKLKAMCVSEAKGAHPKVIETSLVDHQINGVKTYVTAGSDVEEMLVLCKTNEIIKGRPLLKMVHLSQDKHELQIENFELDFMREVKHGKLILNNTQINSSQILAGDGFEQYAKPFRTFEDIFVGASYQAMLLRQAIEHTWEEDVRDRLLLNIYTLKNLLKLAPSDKETHLLLATAEKNFEDLLPNIEKHISNQSSLHFQEDWELNKKVISLSKKLKQVRLSKARNVLFK